MIIHGGIRYWTTEELANSLAARGMIDTHGSAREKRRRARRWAERVNLRPSATTRTGGRLWGDDEVREAIEVDSGVLVPPF